MQGVGRKPEEKNVTVARQFLNPGPSELDELSNSMSSDERTHSGSPLHTSVLSKRPRSIEKGIVDREESPESEIQAGSSRTTNNKAPKLCNSTDVNCVKSVDQQAVTEATMRKARVSVRARSEAPMVL